MTWRVTYALGTAAHYYAEFCVAGAGIVTILLVCQIMSRAMDLDLLLPLTVLAKVITTLTLILLR